VFSTGVMLGLVPLVLDAAFVRGRMGLAAASAYGALTGIAAIAAFAGCRFFAGDRRCWRAAALAVWAVVASELTLWINVALRPNTPLLRPADLTITGLAVGSALACVIGVASAVAWLARRTPRVMLLSDAALLLGATLTLWPLWPNESGARPPHGGTGPDLLLVVMDAARPDHMGVYGYGRPTTPGLLSWVPQARVFEQAYSGSSWTLESVPVLLGATDGSVAPLVNALRGAGYRTACFSDNPLLERGGPLSRGFDHVGVSSAAGLIFAARAFRGSFFGDFAVLWPLVAQGWSDRKLTDVALTWLARQPGPVFVYAHLMDPHQPFRGPSIDGREWSSRRIESPASGVRLSAAEVGDAVAFYDGGIRSADAAASRLLRAFADRGRPFVAVVTADHGEYLGEGGQWRHGATLAPQLLHVPLFVVGVGVEPGRVSQAVGHASVPLTLGKAAGVGYSGLAGSDLRVSQGEPLVKGGLGPSLRYEVEAGVLRVLRQGVLLARYDALASDGAPATGHVVPNAGDDSLPDETRERLRSLGYIE
jgi:hypothetical protein